MNAINFIKLNFGVTYLGNIQQKVLQKMFSERNIYMNIKNLIF